MLESKVTTYDSFHGGITDYYIAGDPYKSRKLDNINLLPSGKKARIIQREGSELYTTTRLNDNNPVLLFRSDNYFYWVSDLVRYWDEGLSAWATPTGGFAGQWWPSYNSADIGEQVTYTKWNSHYYVASFNTSGPALGFNSALFAPKRIYEDINLGNISRFACAGIIGQIGYGAPTVDTPGAGNSYIWAICRKFTYSANGKEYILRSAPEFLQREVGAPISGGNGVTLNFTTPSITSLDGALWYPDLDFTKYKIEIYRTVSNGNVLYYVSEVNNGIASYYDTNQDSNINNNETLYTTGGVLENQGPVACRCFTITEDTGFYGAIRDIDNGFTIGDVSTIRENRILQSIPGSPEWTNFSLYVDLDEPVRGLGSHNGYPIALTENNVYRIDGRFDELGRGGMTAQRISETSSCVAASSVVETERGMFWCGIDAFYWSDGYKVLKLNEDWPDTHRQFTQAISPNVGSFVTDQRLQNNIRGSYDPVKQRIYWSVSRGETSGSSSAVKNEAIVVLHLEFGVKRHATFTIYQDDKVWTDLTGTVVKGSADWPSISAGATRAYQGELYRADERGYIFKHKDSLTSDPGMVEPATQGTWTTEPVRYTYESTQLNLGTDARRKWVPWIRARFNKTTDLAVQIISNNDDDYRVDWLNVINNVQGGTTGGYYEEMRRFPKNSLRCSTKAIRMQNGRIEEYQSGGRGVVTTSIPGAGTGRATFYYGSPGPEWPDQPAGLVGKTISFSHQPDVEFTITAQVLDNVTFSDPNNELIVTTDPVSWTIHSTPSDQRFELIDYTIQYSELGNSQNRYGRSEGGSIIG